MQRWFVVLTDPPDVDVYIDGKHAGTTDARYRPGPDQPRDMQPDTELGILRVPLQNYAVHEVTLRRPGYQTQSYAVEPIPPIWEHFPFDIITEVLLPLNLEMQYLFRFTLEEREAQTFDETYEAASRFRTRAAGRLNVDDDRYAGTARGDTE